MNISQGMATVTPHKKAKVRKKMYKSAFKLDIINIILFTLHNTWYTFKEIHQAQFLSFRLFSLSLYFPLFFLTL